MNGWGEIVLDTFVIEETAFVPLPPAPLPPAPLPQGGGGAYPRRSGKSVRPIWDRGGGASSEPPQAAAAQTQDPSPKKSKPAAGDPRLAKLFLTSALVPVVPPAPAPKALAVKARPARAVASAALIEADDVAVARGTIAVRTHFEGDDLDVGAAIAGAAAEGRGLLVESDETSASAHSLVVGHAIIVEAPDRLTARAAWDDDDLAMKLLLGE